jgi:hypothetical protein
MYDNSRVVGETFNSLLYHIALLRSLTGSNGMDDTPWPICHRPPMIGGFRLGRSSSVFCLLLLHRNDIDPFDKRMLSQFLPQLLGLSK